MSFFYKLPILRVESNTFLILFQILTPVEVINFSAKVVRNFGVRKFEEPLVL
jgi:hypothetical protein